jgi:hypothetical protein
MTFPSVVLSLEDKAAAEAVTLFGPGFPDARLTPVRPWMRRPPTSIRPPLCAGHMATPLVVGVAAQGRKVSWLEINGPQASTRLLTQLLAHTPA